nr:immunoglobulin light chain junction region [Mus musculus]
CQQSKEVPRTF